MRDKFIEDHEYSSVSVFCLSENCGIGWMCSRSSSSWTTEEHTEQIRAPVLFGRRVAIDEAANQLQISHPPVYEIIHPRLYFSMALSSLTNLNPPLQARKQTWLLLALNVASQVTWFIV